MDSGFNDRPRARFAIEPAPEGKRRWTLYAHGNRRVVLARDYQTYDTQEACWKAIWRVQDEAGRAEIDPYETLTAE
jgi:hypothetical protein